ncbi:hypothetical protein CMI37_11695 [Candidatus Pacearchaeota archaeon]|jgi:hypothetical protein|nr:hypothetical protein [Candidatus Pacearchaeota archaeon]|tara:strand:+ start:8011 stop:8604 length:594 start_codon:yes stop_codon:yes gene_type:complete
MALLLKNSIFIHIPKTGGSWVRQATRRSGIVTNEIHYRNSEKKPEHWQHCTPADLNCEGRFTFCFVRHPLDWYASFWAYRKRLGLLTDHELDQIIHTYSFPKYIEIILDKYPSGYVSTMYKKYTYVDYVGRNENLVEDLIKALQLGNEQFNEEVIRKFPRANASASIDPWKKLVEYPPELRERVCEVESDAIKRYYS